MFRFSDAREEKVFRRPHPRGQELRDGNPAFLIEDGNDVERRQQQSHRDRAAAVQKHTQIPPPDGYHHQQQHRNIRRNDRGRHIREPNSGDGQRQRHAHLARRTIAHDPQHHQRQEQRCEQFRKGAAHVDRQQHVRIDRVSDSDQACLRFLEPFARHAVHRQSCEKYRASIEDHGNEQPWDEAAQRAAENPRQRRIKQEARLATAIVCISCPARIENARAPLLRHLQPAVHVEGEIVSAGDASY